MFKDKFFSILNKIPKDKNVYLYTNATLITDDDISMLSRYVNLKCLNVGIHTLKQLEKVNKNLERMLPVRFMARDIYCNELLKTYPNRLSKKNLKGWSLDECDMPNEDWVLLTDFEEA